MYRRVNSGRFIVATTAGIVIVMALFTWVMYGMAQQVFVMTDIMGELNTSIKAMVVTQASMTEDIHAMNANFAAMNKTIADMNGNIAGMTGSVANMSESVYQMTVNVNRMTYDIGQATYAFSQPMSYMWGSPFPF
jgi:small ligand-binding sensory domain FIST